MIVRNEKTINTRETYLNPNISFLIEILLNKESANTVGIIKPTTLINVVIGETLQNVVIKAYDISIKMREQSLVSKNNTCALSFKIYNNRNI